MEETNTGKTCSGPLAAATTSQEEEKWRDTCIKRKRAPAATKKHETRKHPKVTNHWALLASTDAQRRRARAKTRAQKMGPPKPKYVHVQVDGSGSESQKFGRIYADATECTAKQNSKMGASSCSGNIARRHAPRSPTGATNQGDARVGEPGARSAEDRHPKCAAAGERLRPAILPRYARANTTTEHVTPEVAETSVRANNTSATRTGARGDHKQPRG